jgi:hypothetical protein
MPVLYRCQLTILIIFCHVTDIWSLISVFNTKNQQQQQQYCKQSTCLFLSGDSYASSCTAKETQLLDYLDTLYSKNNDRLPCGLDCTEKERLQVSNMVNHLLEESSSSNKANNVKAADIVGEWNLLYTSSRTMMINKSLSGLGRSESDMAKVASIRQKLSGTKYVIIYITTRWDRACLTVRARE